MTRLVKIEHLLRIKCDDKTAKRRLTVKVHATKDDVQKLVALHTMELELKSVANKRVVFTKCIDSEGYFEMSCKLLAVKGLKSANTSF